MTDEGTIRSVLAFQNAYMSMTNRRHKVTGKQATNQKTSESQEPGCNGAIHGNTSLKLYRKE